MRRVVACVVALAGIAGLTTAAFAQNASVTARIGAGQSAQATAAVVPNDGVLLEISLPGGGAQSFPQLGLELVPLSGKAGERALLARDLDGDGADEIIIRGSVPPERGAVLIFRWDRTVGEFVPVTFTNDRDQTTKYLVVDLAAPVLIDPAGTIEAQYETTRQDGRKSWHVARYRWTGQGYSQSADN
ncbi:MAG: hypothetical protein IT539_12105 [Bradyrhizobiaceae bacterium]|nr:hypothetical protein [Bradyrhizobiaceae bacterium]